MADWWEQQGVPPGGAVEPLDDYAPAPQGAQTAVPRTPGSLEGGVGRGNERGTTGAPQPVSDGAVQAILQKYPATNDGMRAAMLEIDRTFGAGTIKLLEHPHRLDKLVMPDGRTIDAMVGAGAPGASWGWMVEGPGHGGGGGYAAGSFGSLVAGPMDGKALTDDPGFQFRMKEGAKAIERSAAARGTLLTGRTLKDLTRWGQDYASNEYQNAWNRGFTQQGAVFDRLYRTSALGASATGNAGQLASGYAANAGNLLTAQGQAQAAGTIGQANANAATIGNLANLYGQWHAGRSTANGGDYLEQGVY